MQTIIPIITDERIANIRQGIIDMMKKSRDEELEHIKNSPTVRYYKMTESEFQEAQKSFYIFTIFLGGFPESGNEIEGYIYDIRTLLREKYIVINEQVCYIPIPLSSKRWNYLMKKYPNIGDFTYETGRLTFPLYRTELTYIFKNIRTNPIICSTSKGYIPMTLEHLQKVVGLIKLSDESSQNRFGTVIESSISSSNLNSTFPISPVASNIPTAPTLATVPTISTGFDASTIPVPSVAPTAPTFPNFPTAPTAPTAPTFPTAPITPTVPVTSIPLIASTMPNGGVDSIVDKGQMMNERVNRVINSVKTELEDLSIDPEIHSEVYSKLMSEKTREYVTELLEKGKSETHIISSLFSDSIDALLSKK